MRILIILLLIWLSKSSFGQPNKMELKLNNRWQEWQSITLDSAKYQPKLIQTIHTFKTIENSSINSINKIVDSLKNKIVGFPVTRTEIEYLKSSFLTLNEIVTNYESFLPDTIISNVYLCYGAIYESFGQREKAIEIFEKGILLDSTNFDLLLRSSYAYGQIHYHRQLEFEYIENAVKNIEKALPIAPNFRKPEVIRKHGELLEKALGFSFVKHDYNRTKKYQMLYEDTGYDRISIEWLEKIDIWLLENK